jgi:hypothetical protein
MPDITEEMFLNWNGEEDTNINYLTALVVEMLNYEDIDQLNELRQAIIKENRSGE